MLAANDDGVNQTVLILALLDGGTYSEQLGQSLVIITVFFADLPL